MNGTGMAAKSGHPEKLFLAKVNGHQIGKDDMQGGDDGRPLWKGHEKHPGNREGRIIRKVKSLIMAPGGREGLRWVIHYPGSVVREGQYSKNTGDLETTGADSMSTSLLHWGPLLGI